MELGEVEIGAQKSGDDDNRRTIPTRNTQAVIDRGGVQKKDLGGEKGLGPKTGGIGFRRESRGKLAPLRNGCARCCLFQFTPQVRRSVRPRGARERARGNAALQNYTP